MTEENKNLETTEESENLDDWAFYIDEQGQEQSIHIPTGVIAKRDLHPKDMDNYILVKTPEGIRWFPRNSIHLLNKEAPYSVLLLDKIVSAVVEGSPLNQACQRAGISYSTLCKWRRTIPDVKLLLDQAKLDRGEVIFEKMLQVAEDTPAQRDEVALGKLRADIYQHVSAVENDRFNLKQKVAQDVRIGIVSVETGIRRPGDAGFEEKEIFGEIEARQSNILDHVQPVKKIINEG